MKILLAKNLGNLVPVDDEGRDALRGFKYGEILTAEIKKPRNIQHHRKFFAMLKIIYENQEHYKSVEDIRHVCLIEIGEYKIISGKDGKEYPKTKSMNFASMDQLQFNALYDKAIEWVTTVVIPGLAAKDIDEMVILELHNF